MSYPVQPTSLNVNSEVHVSKKDRIPEFRNDQNYDASPTIDFTKKAIRHGFIRKVFGIFSIQILFTLGLISLINFLEPVRMHFHDYTEIWIIIPLLLATVLFVLLMVKSSWSKIFPLNFILLGIFTSLVATLLGSVVVFTEQDHFFYAGGMLLLPCCLITLYAFQTKFDIKWYFQLLIGFFSVGMATLAIYFLIPPTKLDVLWISTGGAVGIFIYLTVFIHSIMAQCCFKNGRLENYIIAALSVYVVVAAVLLVILILFAARFGGCSDSNGGCGGGSPSSSSTCYYFPFFYWGPCYSSRKRSTTRDEPDDYSDSSSVSSSSSSSDPSSA